MVGGADLILICIYKGLAAAPTVPWGGDDVDDDNDIDIDNVNVNDLNIDDAGKPGTEGENGVRLGERGTCKGGTSRQQRSGQEIRWW